jgi:hypothetical protein
MTALSRLVEKHGGLRLQSISTRVLDLTGKENKMYGRLLKTGDEILGFLTAENVSSAVVEVTPGRFFPLDSRPDKPAHKDCELAEAAKAIQNLLVKIAEVENRGGELVIAEVIHVISEIGDVIYNLLQLYSLGNLPSSDPRAIIVPQISLANIKNLFSHNDHADLVMFMALVGLTKFTIRYELLGKKNVVLEEEMLITEFGDSVGEVIAIYGGLTSFVKAVKQSLFNFYAAGIDATNGKEHILSQMLATGAILQQIYHQE